MSTAPTTTSRRRKAQEFHLPDGRKVVVALPDDVATVKQRYEALPDMQVEVVLHGSDEHHNYLRESKEHHEKRRQDLRERHGPAFDEWETVQTQLDAVTEQLERLTDQTSALNANFSKFGYNAHLRTYDDDSGGEGAKSGRLSATDGNSSASLWEDINSGETIKLFKRPVIKQYFHRGLLWRASEETLVMSFELFFDLLYVGIIHVNGEHVAEEANGHELLRFVITFIMSWKIWSDVTQLISWFETDDVLQRLEILVIFACLLGFTTNMIQSFYEDAAHNTYTLLVSFYLAARFFAAAHCVLTGALLPLVRGVMVSLVVLTLIPAALWIGSIHIEMPGRLGLIFAALFLDIFGGSAIVGAFRFSQSHDSSFARSLMHWFEFYPAINIEHKVERTNAFVSLVLGYSVISVLFQNYSFGINAFLGKAILGLCQAFVFNWLYFDVDGSNIHLHAIRRHVWSTSLWQYAHLPFILSYVLASAALSKLVVATDFPNADAHDLTHLYEERSEPEIANAIRYFYCHGLAIALLSMGAISFSHEHKIPREMRIPKNYRLLNRVAVCVILFLLPLAHEINSLNLISITLGLVIWVLLWEIWGLSCKDESFFAKDCQTRYAAKCCKKDLERAMKSNGEVDVVELGKGEKTGIPMQP